MKKLIVTCFLGCALFLPGFLNAQTITTANKETAVSTSQVLAYAKEAKQATGKRQHMPIKMRLYIEQSSPLIAKALCNNVDYGYNLINKVYALGTKITAAEAMRYDAEMNRIITEIDKLSTGLQQGNDIPKCFGGCDSNYPGLGGGNGWKRFTCKMACLIVETAN